jgi:hypothetical protein
MHACCVEQEQARDDGSAGRRCLHVYDSVSGQLVCLENQKFGFGWIPYPGKGDVMNLLLVWLILFSIRSHSKFVVMLIRRSVLV